MQKSLKGNVLSVSKIPDPDLGRDRTGKGLRDGLRGCDRTGKEFRDSHFGRDRTGRGLRHNHLLGRSWSEAYSPNTQKYTGEKYTRESTVHVGRTSKATELGTTGNLLMATQTDTTGGSTTLDASPECLETFIQSVMI